MPVRKIIDWFDERTGAESTVKHFLYEQIPQSSGWHQVFGSVALFLFLVQAFTGILLAFNFAATPGDAYYSVKYIMSELTGGSIVRGLHHWGATMMIIVVGLHMIQVAIWGAYKKPREATWIVGVVLLLLVLAFGITGYLLPWDNHAYWATVVTTQIAGLAPIAGPYIIQLLGAESGSVGVIAFSRFYGLHVMLLPALTTLLIVLHVYLVRKHGVAPAAGDQGPKKSFYPGQVFKDTVAIFVVFAITFVLAVSIDAPLGELADPTDTSYVPRPEWYFLFLFETLKFFEGSGEVIGAVILPTLALLALAFVPLLDRGRPRPLRERKVATAVVTAAFLGWSSLTVAAIATTPAGQDELREPAPAWANLAPIELAGLAYFRQQDCASCHNLTFGEPKIGPTLSTLAERKSAGWMIRHFQNPAAVVPGSPMPATELSTQQLNTLAAFLLQLSPSNADSLAAAPDFAVDGARIYEENFCSSCHQVNGAGLEVGPPLTGVGSRRTRDWLRQKISNPQQSQPDSSMPIYDMPPDQLEILASYLLALPGT